MTAPLKDGSGGGAMEMAIAEAGITPEQIGISMLMVRQPRE